MTNFSIMTIPAEKIIDMRRHNAAAHFEFWGDYKSSGRIGKMSAGVFEGDLGDESWRMRLLMELLPGGETEFRAALTFAPEQLASIVSATAAQPSSPDGTHVKGMRGRIIDVAVKSADEPTDPPADPDEEP